MIDDPADLELVLCRWARAYGENPHAASPATPDRGGGPGPHPLSQAQQFAPGRKDKRRHQHRAGYGRREVMGKAAGLRHAVPAWSCEPIRGAQTRSAARRYYPDPVADVVDRAVADMAKWNPLMALCLRLEYCASGQQQDKADRVAATLNRPVPVRRYRMELEHARIWLAGNLRGGL
jgi:hypothetical protein